MGPTTGRPPLHTGSHNHSAPRWMKRQSDLVQGTALAFAEREVLEACLRQLQEVRRGEAKS